MSVRDFGAQLQRGVSDFLTARVTFVGILVVLLTLPYWFGAVGGYMSLATTMVIWMIFAVGYDIELGYAGQLSLAHTIMFGIGGYGTGLLLLHVTESSLIAILLPLVVVGIAAPVIGWVAHRTSGLFFALVTLAFTMLFYFSATQFDAVGGFDGLAGFPTFLTDPVFEYYAVLGVLVGVTLIAYHLVESPLGKVLTGVRENEKRLEHLGYNVTRYKVSSFLISGLYAGLAGTMLAGTSGFVGPEVFYWTTAFQPVIYVIIGGMGTVTGPLIAAGLLVALESIVSGRVDHWDPLLGMLFIAVIVFFPAGFYGIISNRRGNSS